MDYEISLTLAFSLSLELYFVLLMKSHLQSYPCPLQINSFWNLGFFLGITIILQIITGIFLGLHFTSDLNSAYSSVFFFIFEIVPEEEVVTAKEDIGDMLIIHFLFILELCSLRLNTNNKI